jgi:hypothetical protein
MNADQVIILARKNLGGLMESSARLCLEDAINLRDSGKYEYARKRAIASLAYSVGVFHADYKKVVK